MKFSELKIEIDLIEVLVKNNFIEMTDIQSEVIPKILNNKKVIVSAPSGSGKTLSFLIPLINNIDINKNEIQSLILVPTIELADQIYQLLKLFSTKMNFKIAKIDDAYKYKNNTALPKIVVGTPKKALNAYENYNFPLTLINTLIIDEADMIIELGFFYEIEMLLKKIKRDIKIHFFSSTISTHLQNSIKKYIKGNVERINLNVTKEGNNVKHFWINTKGIESTDYIFNKIVTGKFNPYLAMIFCYDKKQANNLYSNLRNNKIKNVGIISSEIEKKERIKLLKKINDNKFQFIISTDLACRGIDIDNISHVINIGLPYDFNYYIHRSGRTGRYKSEGESIILINNKIQNNNLTKLISKYKINIIEKKEL